MKLVKKILKKLDGLYYPQEYLCLNKETFEQPLHVYLSSEGRVIKDITNEHLFTCYSPLLITLCSSTGLPKGVEILFTREPHQQNGSFRKKDAIARLWLTLIRTQVAGEYTLYHYEATGGSHHFINPFHRYIIALRNRLFNNKPGNVFLAGNLYKQVQIAYSIPRVISLITVSDGSLFNLFPTDLHGPVHEKYYICSLRHQGKACKQVEAARKIVISEIDSAAYKTVYALGKNHMQELKPKDQFPFSAMHSSVFQLPLPESTLRYRELELMESFSHGIHQLLLFRVISSQVIKEGHGTLSHVHNCYASWHHKQGLSSNFLLR